MLYCFRGFRKHHKQVKIFYVVYSNVNRVSELYVFVTFLFLWIDVFLVILSKYTVLF